jgi:hypothetical protein
MDDGTPSTDVATRLRPGGAYAGATALTTAVLAIRRSSGTTRSTRSADSRRAVAW